VTEPQILLSSGSEDMLKQIVHCYLRPGETLLVPRYSWWYYAAAAREVDGLTMQYPLRIVDQNYGYDISAIDTLIKLHQPRLVIIASPNNPTGNTLSDNDLIDLLRLYPETRFVLDEAYHGFAGIEHDETPRLISLYPNLIVLRTFSKLYALASLRIGYAFAGSAYKKLTTYSARYLGYNTLSERIALAAMEDDPLL
jgi:histidinol-phosphate aminotransferase